MKTDSAITHPCEDKLDTKFFSFILAKSLLSFFNQRDSVVVGICGEWGEGKTSIINMALKYLEVLHKEYSEDIENVERKITTRKVINNNKIKRILTIIFWLIMIALAIFYYKEIVLFLFLFNTLSNIIIGGFIIYLVYLFINKILIFIAKKLFGNRDYIVIHFNPWNYTNTEQMLRAFFKNLAEELTYINDKELNIIANLIVNYAKAAHNIDLSLITKIKQIGGDNDIKNQINNILCKSDKKIFVIIDDIDRLLPNEILLIFKTVKIIADFPNTVYLLSYDKSNVKKALATLKIDAEDYIKKIVQIDKNIPIINKDVIKEKFISELEKIPNSEYKNTELIIKFYDCALSKSINNLRDYNRFINTFEFNYTVYKNEEINILDLIGITAIEVFEPDLYQFIKNNKYLLCTGGVSFAGKPQILMYDGSEKTASEVFQEILKFKNIAILSVLFARFFSEIDRYIEKCTDADLKNDFEKLKLLLPNLTPFVIKTYKHRQENYRNISNPNYFSMYFKANLGNNSLTKKEKETLDNSLNNPALFIKELNKLLTVNPDKISDYMNNWTSLYNKKYRTKERTLQLLNSLLQINKNEKNLLNYLEKTDFFVVFTRDFLNMYNDENPTNKLSKQDVVSVLEKNIFNLKENLFFFVFLICWQFEFPIDSKPVLTKEELVLKQQVYNLLLENLTLESLLNSDDAFQCLDYLIEYFSCKEKIKDFFDTLLQEGNEESLCKILVTASNYKNPRLLNSLSIIVQVVNSLDIKQKVCARLLQIHENSTEYSFLSKNDYNVYDEYSCRTADIVTLALEYLEDKD